MLLFYGCYINVFVIGRLAIGLLVCVSVCPKYVVLQPRHTLRHGTSNQGEALPCKK